MPQIIHIVVSDLFPGDAIGNFVLAVRNRLRRLGISVALYAERYGDQLHDVQSYAAFFSQVQPEDVLFYQLSNYDPALSALMATPCRRVVYYHNITPGYFFAPYAPEIASQLDAGRSALPLISSTHAILANSRYSLTEVENFLPPKIPRKVFPPFLVEQLSSLQQKGGGSFAENEPYLLTLGRVVPHKCIESSINIVALMRKKFPNLRLMVVGGHYEPYVEKLRQHLADAPTLEEAVTFTGALPRDAIQKLLCNARGLLHTSAHEGFGIPLLEAMLSGIPVFATPRAAIPETMGDAGILISPGNLNEAAAKISDIFLNQNARATVLAAQAKQAETLMKLAQGESLFELLQGEASTSVSIAPQPFTILFVTHDFMVGGLEQVVIDIAVLAKSKGYRAIIGYSGQIAESTRIDVEQAGLEHFRLPESDEERLIWLRQHKIDIVNAHYATILASQCKELEIPFLQTIHNMYLWLDEKGIAAWQALDAHTSWYIAVSAKAAQIASQRLGLAADKMTIVPNGVAIIDRKMASPPERDELLKQGLGIPPDGIVFLQLGSVHPVKAQWITLEAFAEARKVRSDIYLVLLGKESDKDYAEKTRKKIQQLDLSDCVQMLGYRKDVHRFLNLSRALLAPSFIEGWSLAISEAIQLGVLVVATDVGGASEQLSGTSGILLPAFTEDFAGLSASMYLSALTDESLHKRLAPPLTQAILDMAKRPIRNAALNNNHAIRRPEEAYTEHLKIMRRLARCASKDEN